MADELAGRAFLLQPEAMAAENLRFGITHPDHPASNAAKKEKQEGKTGRESIEQKTGALAAKCARYDLKKARPVPRLLQRAKD
jgi:hypothetical protein